MEKMFGKLFETLEEKKPLEILSLFENLFPLKAKITIMLDKKGNLWIKLEPIRDTIAKINPSDTVKEESKSEHKNRQSP